MRFSNCYFCDSKLEAIQPQKCSNCNTYHIPTSFKHLRPCLREVVFYLVKDKYSFQISHNFLDNKTEIYRSNFTKGQISFKPVLRIDLLDISPTSAKEFIENKLHLYMVFS